MSRLADARAEFVTKTQIRVDARSPAFASTGPRVYAPILFLLYLDSHVETPKTALGNV